MKKVILLCAVAMLVSACGGGGGGGYAAIPPAVGASGSGDTFLDSVLMVVNGPTADDTPTVNIDAYAVTTPDDTPPIVVM